MNYKNLLLIILNLSVILSSCNNHTKDKKKDYSGLENDKYEIISLLLNKLQPGSPPPPPASVNSKRDTIFLKRYMDSVNKLDVSIVVLDHFIGGEKIPNDLKVKFGKDFKFLLERLENNKGDSNFKIKFQSLDITKNRKLIPVSETSRDILQQKEASYYVAFSDVIFNKQRNKAVVYSLVNMGPLFGGTNIYLLEKKEGAEKWQILIHKSLSIS